MRMLESLRIALDALLANKLRSVLTMLGIIIGVAAVICVVAVGQGTQQKVVGEIEKFGTNFFIISTAPPTSNSQVQRQDSFDLTDIQKLKDMVPEITEVIYNADMRAAVAYGGTTLAGAAITGTSHRYIDVINLVIEYGRYFTQSEEEQAARVVVLGAGSATKLFGEGNERRAVGQVIRIAGYPFTVIGVLKSDTGFMARIVGGGPDSYYTPITVVRGLTGNRNIRQLIVQTKKGVDTAPVIETAKDLLTALHPRNTYQVTSIQEAVSSLTTVTNTLTTVISAIAGISLLVGGVGIMNIMLVSVTERTREIGIRKALGARRRDILLQFVIEAVTVSVLGGLIGVVIAGGLARFIGNQLTLDVRLSPLAMALALGFSVGVGIIFGVYPASKAARLDPIEALRYE